MANTWFPELAVQEPYEGGPRQWFPPAAYQALTIPTYEELVLAHPALTGYWKFDETAGATVVEDSVGNVDSVTTWLYDPGDPGIDGRNALGFSGTGGNVSMGSIAAHSLTGSSPWSIEVWVKSSLSGTDFMPLWNRDYISGANGWHLLIGPVYNNVRFWRKDSNGAMDDIYSADGVLIDNVWNHIVVTCDGTTIRMYVNGALVASDPLSANALIGNGGFGFGGTYFNGLLDEAAIYSDDLDTATIISHYRKGTGVAASFIDDFSTSAVGSEWTQDISGTWTISGGVLTPENDADNKVITRTAGPPIGDGKVRVKFTGAGGINRFYGVTIVRQPVLPPYPFTYTKQFLMFLCRSDGNAELYRYKSGAFSVVLDSGIAMSMGANGILEIEKAGNDIDCRLLDTGGNVLSEFGHTLTGADIADFGVGVSGHGGIYHNAGACTFDEFQVIA